MTPSSSSSMRNLVIAVAVGLCFGIMIGMMFTWCGDAQQQSHHSSSSSSSSNDSPVAVVASPQQPSMERGKSEQQRNMRSDHDDENTNHNKNSDENNGNAKTVHKRDDDDDGGVPSSFSSWDCDSEFSVESIRRRYLHIRDSQEGQRLFSKSTLHKTVWHFNATMSFLNDAASRRCWKQINEHRRSSSATSSRQHQRLSAVGTSSPSFFFYDLGSRKLDQTTAFLSMYPGARKFQIICVEPNPKFNSLYVVGAAAAVPPAAGVNHHRVGGQLRGGGGGGGGHHRRLFHVNAAVGIVPDKLVLSDRQVGSSIVVENKQHQKKGGSSNEEEGMVVDVVPFLDLLLLGKGAPSSSSSKTVPFPSSHRDRVVVKMDVEKAEFAILHHLVRSGALSLISELLLECHYNTNMPRAARNMEVHIGLDDCQQLVSDLRDASGGTMEVVLWNSVKTARMTGRGYIERHGGFFPT